MLSATYTQEGFRPFYLRYYPKLEHYFKSRHAPKIIDRLEYWFKNQKFKNGFFKFLEPCSHHLYREGDSWHEEVGLRRLVFNAAFDLIGVRYRSKSLFRQATDPFQGKLYASFYDRKTNRMHYVRNHAFAEQFLRQLFAQQVVKKAPKPRADIAQINTSQTPPLQQSCTDEKHHSYGGTIGGNIDNKQLQTKSSQAEEKIDQVLIEQMHQVWHQELGIESNHPLLSGLKSQMLTSLKQNFNHSLENWKHYCQKIASSKFLMGEMPNTHFKAWLHWAIKPDAINRINNCEFSLGDRQKPIDENARDFQLARHCQNRIAQHTNQQQKNLHQALYDRFGAHAYKHWFQDLVLDKVESRVVQLVAPTRFIKNHLDVKYGVDLSDLIQRVFTQTSIYQISYARIS